MAAEEHFVIIYMLNEKMFSVAVVALEGDVLYLILW